MTLSLVGTPTAFVAAATSVASAFPGGYTVVADDLACLIVWSKHRTETTVPAIPSGWTQVGTGLGGVTAAGVDAGKIRITIFRRDLIVGDTAPTVSQAGGTGNFVAAAIYVLRKSAAGTYVTVLDVLSEATSGTTWLESTTGTPDWTTDDLLILPSGATTDSVTGFSVGSVTGTGLTVSTPTENIDAGTTQGDDARLTCANAAVTAGPATAVGTRALTISGVSSTGAMGILRVRHVAAAADATVSAVTVVAVASIPTVIVESPPGALIAGQSSIGSVDLLAFGASTTADATLFPLVVQATAVVPAGPVMLWGPPAGLTATVLSSSAIRLNWNPVLAADGYDVERDDVVIAFSVVGTQYDDTGLAPSTAYDYRVRAVR